MFLHKLKHIFSKEQTELHALVEEREEDAAPLTSHEKELITNAFQFRNLEADEISIPRSEVTYLKIEDSFQAVLDTFQKTRYSRLPVVGEDLDDVLGFITLKDIICFVNMPDDFVLKTSLRPATFVPDNMPLPRVLQLMKKSRIQLVMVADEYGGTAGLLSLKDILEELVGEVEDEHEAADTPLYKSIGINRYWVDAKLPIADAVRDLKLKLPLSEEDDADDLPYETMGGLILHLAGRLPENGESLSIGPHKATIIEADGRRVQAIEIAI